MAAIRWREWARNCVHCCYDKYIGEKMGIERLYF